MIATIQGIAEEDICSDVDVDTEVNPVPCNDVPTTLAERLEAIASREIKLERHEMTEEQYEQLSKLIYDNLDLFTTSLKDLVGTDAVTHHIDTEDSPPIKKQPV